MATCRVCGKSEYEQHRFKLVKYSTRHYAHADCALEKWGAAFFDRLTPWQVAHQFPYMAAREAGLVDELVKRSETASDLNTIEKLTGRGV